MSFYLGSDNILCLQNGIPEHSVIVLSVWCVYKSVVVAFILKIPYSDFVAAGDIRVSQIFYSEKLFKFARLHCIEKIP